MASPTTTASATSSPTTRAAICTTASSAAMGVSWLRGKGRELAAHGKPWFLAVNLVNPHDVMFYDTDAPGMPGAGKRGIWHLAATRSIRCMPKQWQFKLPASHFQALDARGRPPAHRDFLRSHDALVGEIPTRSRAGAGGTTTTSTACATPTATSPRCWPNWMPPAWPIARSSC
jgi:hypothetical protein